MDFAIQPSANGGDQSFNKAPNILNNVYLSLAIIRGSWWLDPKFGMRDTRRLKNTEGNTLVVRGWCLEALQWIVDAGRARSIEVYVERDKTQDVNRLKAVVTVLQADGQQVSYERFFEVV